jgi:hypothetical protein
VTRPPGERATAVELLCVAVIALCGLFAGLVEVLLVPLYIGSVIMPIAVVCALAGNVALPRLAHSVVPRMSAALAPLLGWLLVVLALDAVARPEGDVILPGTPVSVELVGFGVLFGGALVGTITLVWLSPPPRKVSR